MRGRGQLILGGFLILIGVLAVLDNLLGIDFGDLFLPLVFIGLGLLIIFRPQMAGPDTDVGVRVFGDIRRGGDWEVKDIEYWSFIGDIKLDLTEANIPPGETRIRVYGFIGDLKLRIPEGLGVEISNVGFVTESKVLENRMGGFLTPVDWKTEGYEAAEKKIDVEMINFIGGIRVTKA
ncbi:MAG: hypothetical protein GTO14_18735 [Anaerolineales bacterium]|nr:hypothetical protein [Anaerolineales bacterium]